MPCLVPVLIVCWLVLANPMVCPIHAFSSLFPPDPRLQARATIWGHNATAGEQVNIQLDRQTTPASTTVGTGGDWLVHMYSWLGLDP